MTSFSGKVVVVTGGSQGLGRAIAEAFGKAGAKVVIAARSAETLEQAAAELKTKGVDAQPVVCDVTQQADVDRLIATTVQQHGKIDVLVNAAGRSMRGAILDTTPEQFQELLDVNFLSAVRCTQAAAPHLIAARGHVVNIGSLAAKTAPRHLGAYPASKFPLAAYSQQLRLETGAQGVHILLVCPGPIQRNDSGERYHDQAAELPGAAQLPGGGAKLKGVSPDWLAQRIVRACARREAELVIPRKARILFAISQLSPRLGDWLLEKWT